MDLLRCLTNKRILFLGLLLLLAFSNAQVWARGGGGGHGGGGGGFGGGGHYGGMGYYGGAGRGGVYGGTNDAFLLFMLCFVVLGFAAYFLQGPLKILFKTRKVQALLLEMAKQDPEWDEKHLSQMVRDSFLEIQKAWCNLDMSKLKECLGPVIYDHWDQELKEFHRRDLRNLMDRLTVDRIQFVNVWKPRHPEKPLLTACIDAGAVDYFVDDKGKTLDYSERRMEKAKLPFKKFREFWTFEKEGPKTWKLYRVDQAEDWTRTVNRTIVNLD